MKRAANARILVAWCLVGGAALTGCDAPRAGATADACIDPDASSPADDPQARPCGNSTVPRESSVAATSAGAGASVVPAGLISCRAIAVDGPVRADSDAGATAGPDALAVRGEIPSDTWLTLEPNAHLVAKDPRTTRETAFAGPARVRPCVGHREESWLLGGRFESAIGAGETPGAEEWVVTPFAVIRYMAAQVRIDVRKSTAAITVGASPVFLSLADDAHELPLPSNRSADAGATATTSIDDDGWLRMTGGTLTLGLPTRRPPAEAAAAMVDRCVALARAARDLADALFAGLSTVDGGASKDQVRVRRMARAACAIAAVRVETLAPAAGTTSDAANSARSKAELSHRVETALAAWGGLAPPSADRGLAPPSADAARGSP